ncbi:MAG: hypothetical protein WC802_02645 [Patescibacteria group bacterium]
MKITLCGSLKFLDDMVSTKNELESLGHSVYMPPTQITLPDGREISTAEMYATYKTA